MEYQLTSCNSMFRGRTNITMIDLTNLDFSSVNNMESFFDGYSSLKTVDFNNKDV